MTIRLGSLAPRLRDQFTNQGIKVDRSDLKDWQRDADAITLLHIHGLLSDTLARTCRQRLVKMIERGIKK